MQMLKKVALFIVAVSVILTVVAVVAFPPTRWESTEGTVVRSYERHWKWLPLSEWGLRPEGVIGCGPFGSASRHQWRFGFFALSEEETWWKRQEEAQNLKQRDAMGR
jgi:hypothetical protein